MAELFLLVFKTHRETLLRATSVEEILKWQKHDRRNKLPLLIELFNCFLNYNNQPLPENSYVSQQSFIYS